MIWALGLIALVLASAERPRVALAVSPARLDLTAPSSRRIMVRNDGAERVVINLTRRGASKWLQIVPARLTLRPGRSASLTVRMRRVQRAEPGVHPGLVLLTTQPVRGGRVKVQARVGVRIRMHVPGRVVRRLRLGRLRVIRDSKKMLVSVANRGNVTVQLRGRVTAALVRRGKQVARLRSRARRALPPGARTLVALRYPGRVRGRVTAVVRVRIGSGIPAFERRYRLRL